MKRKSLIILIILGFSLSIHAALSSGVRFKTQVPKTFIKLFENSNEPMPSELGISFDMYLAQPLSIGQILMVECGNTTLSLTYIGRNKNNCSFVLSPVSDKKKYIEVPFDASKCEEGKWFNVSLKILKKNQFTSITLDGKTYVLSNVEIPTNSYYNIYFGPNDSGLSDVTPMAIANVVVTENEKVKHVFPLNESEGKYAFDTLSQARAKVENPIWLINSHHYWKHLGSYRAVKSCGITYDSRRSKLIIVNTDTLASLNIRNNTYTLIPIEAEQLAGFSGEAVYSNLKDIILYYNLYDGDGVTNPFISKLSTDGRVINYIPYTFHNPLHHHATLWDESHQSLYIFGGYGNYSYSDKLLFFNESDNKWDSITTKGDRIAPRMHTIAGEGPQSNLFYIYGGIGNETGKQELGKEFYSDLYLLNIETKEIKRLWADSNQLSYLVPKRNLIYDNKENAVLFLCTNRNNGKIALYSFDVKTGKHKRVSNETLVNTNCINSTAYLFYDTNIQKYCMAVKQADDNKLEAKIEVFTLNYPAITYEQLNKFEKSNSSTWILSICICLSVIIIGFIFLRKKTKKVKTLKNNIGNKESSINEVSESLNGSTDQKDNAIYLFGEFTVTNREGVNISARFSPKIKQILVLILLNSIKHNEGISTEKLSLSIWTNKDVSEAKNIRGVTINHLRTLLKELDGISLVYEDEKWTLILEDQCYCDYKMAIELQKLNMNLDSIRQILSILKRGALLPAFYQYEWFEKSKIEYDEFLFSLLENGLPVLYDNKHWNDTVLATNILFSFDRLNEPALRFKVIALSKLGKQESAQKTYDRFCKEYLICYNEKYKLKFSDINFTN